MHTTTLTATKKKTIGHRFTTGDTLTNRRTGEKWAPLWTVEEIFEHDGEPCYRLTYEDTLSDDGRGEAAPTSIEFADEHFGRVGGRLGALEGKREAWLDVTEDVVVEHRFAVGDRLHVRYDGSDEVIPETISDVDLSAWTKRPIYRYEGGGYDFVAAIDAGETSLAPRFSVGDVVTWGVRRSDFRIDGIDGDRYRMTFVGYHDDDREEGPATSFLIEHVDPDGVLVETEEKIEEVAVEEKDAIDTALDTVRRIRTGLVDIGISGGVADEIIREQFRSVLR